MPKEILDEDLVYQSFPLDIKPENVRIVPAAEFFEKAGIPATPFNNPPPSQ
jgi:hypothetical protein